MKIDPNPINRWLSLLADTETSVDLIPADAQVRLNTARGQHRPWIVACLGAIAAQRAGVPIEWHADLPPIAFPAPAAIGAVAANAVFEAYLCFCLGCDGARQWLIECTRSLGPTALRAGIDDNPEPWWANELLILHALQSFAMISREPGLDEALNRCVQFHLAEIQPDHATNEPWAIHAFASRPAGALTAETLLHAAMVHGGGRFSPVARLILADARHALATSLAR